MSQVSHPAIQPARPLWPGFVKTLAGLGCLPQLGSLASRQPDGSLVLYGHSWLLFQGECGHHGPSLGRPGARPSLPGPTGVGIGGGDLFPHHRAPPPTVIREPREIGSPASETRHRPQCSSTAAPSRNITRQSPLSGQTRQAPSAPQPSYNYAQATPSWLWCSHHLPRSPPPPKKKEEKSRVTPPTRAPNQPTNLIPSSSARSLPAAKEKHQNTTQRPASKKTPIAMAHQIPVWRACEDCRIRRVRVLPASAMVKRRTIKLIYVPAV